MERYKNRGGDSGIVSYQIEPDFITVKFSDGVTYIYTNQSAGNANIEHMKKLAIAGEGLNSFINRCVRKCYARKMDAILTIAQIEAQFASEWVLVEAPQTNDALEVQSGKVRWHSKDREEVYRQAVALRPKRFAILYTGKMPEDTAIVL